MNQKKTQNTFKFNRLGLEKVCVCRGFTAGLFKETSLVPPVAFPF